MQLQPKHSPMSLATPRTLNNLPNYYSSALRHQTLPLSRRVFALLLAMSNTGTTPAPGGEASSADETARMPLPTTPSPDSGTGLAPGSASTQRRPTPPLSPSSSSSCSSCSSCLSSPTSRAPSSRPSFSSATALVASSSVAGSSHNSESDSNSDPVGMPSTSASLRDPPLRPPSARPRVRARRTGARGLDIHVHWADEQPDPATPAPAAAAAAAAASSGTAAPAVAPAADPPSAGVRPPPTPYKSPMPMDNRPQAYVISPCVDSGPWPLPSGVFTDRGKYRAPPVWGSQAPMPVLVTNPPMMAPSAPVPGPGSARWCK